MGKRERERVGGGGRGGRGGKVDRVRFRNFCTYTNFISSKIDMGEKASLWVPSRGAIPGRRSVSQEAPTAHEYVVAGAGISSLSPPPHVDPSLHR